MKVLVKHYAGSIAYGTNLPSSDTDIRGIYCANLDNFTNPFKHPEIEYTIPDEEDGKLYELSFYISKYVKCNPTIIESLWVDESDIIEADPLYWRLREYREKLLTKSVGDSFVGYATQQLKRINGHNKWIGNPMPKEAPNILDYMKPVLFTKNAGVQKKGFKVRDYEETHTLVKYSSQIYGLVKGSDGKKFDINAAKDGKQSEDPSVVLKLSYDEYTRAKNKHKQYWTWKKERNEARAELEADHGYDTKHAMHLIRILRMGVEILSGKGVIVKRPDAEELLEIRAGKYTLEQLLEESDKCKAQIRELEKKPIFDKEPRVDPLKVLNEIRDEIWHGPVFAKNHPNGVMVTPERWEELVKSGIVLPEDTAAFWGTDGFHYTSWSAFGVRPELATHVFYCTI